MVYPYAWLWVEGDPKHTSLSILSLYLYRSIKGLYSTWSGNMKMGHLSIIAMHTSGAHEPPKAAKERVTREYSRVPCKYKSWERASSNDFTIFGKRELVNCVRDAVKRGITVYVSLRNNLYLHGTRVTRSFGGSCAPDTRIVTIRSADLA